MATPANQSVRQNELALDVTDFTTSNPLTNSVAQHKAHAGQLQKHKFTAGVYGSRHPQHKQEHFAFSQGIFEFLCSGSHGLHAFLFAAIQLSQIKMPKPVGLGIFSAITRTLFFAGHTGS
jgi:hypothetical protein